MARLGGHPIDPRAHRRVGRERYAALLGDVGVGVERDVGDAVALADEERALELSHQGKGLTDDDQARLRELEVALDQCWDLLRQRRARRNAGLPDDDAKVRDPGTVEHYQQ